MNIELEKITLYEYEVSKHGWHAWLLLGLRDKETDDEIAEWFMSLATSGTTYNPKLSRLDQAELDKRIVMGQMFDIAFATDTIRGVFNAMHFADWDDFYNKMSSKFIYED